ncbi:recombinase A [Salmonella enterica subsp. enterica]|uniref:Recombinase A n=1 Tax=Salmonella enterica I TaxID=59201 RepID=A0A447TX00_SALET|nr:recombinase A [Salmonella enterica subsp. enterica]
MAIDENKQKALAAALGQIEKQFGKGSIMRLGEDRSMDVENHLHRFAFTGHRTRCGRSADGAYRRNLRAGIFR